MSSSLRDTIIGVFMATTAVIAPTSAVLAADASQLGLLEAQDLYLSASNVVITEKCAPKDGDIVCNMKIVYGSDSRIQNATVTYEGDDAGNITNMHAEAEKAEFYTYSVGQGEQIIKDVLERAGRANTLREANPFDADIYQNIESHVTFIEQQLSENNVFAAGGTYRSLDDVLRLRREGEGVSESNCKLVPVAGEAANFSVNLPQSSRTFCVTQEYNTLAGMRDQPFVQSLTQEDKGTPEKEDQRFVHTKLSIYSLNVTGGLMSAVIQDFKLIDAAPNGAISDNDRKKVDNSNISLGSDPTVQILR